MSSGLSASFGLRPMPPALNNKMFGAREKIDRSSEEIHHDIMETFRRIDKIMGWDQRLK